MKGRGAQVALWALAMAGCHAPSHARSDAGTPADAADAATDGAPAGPVTITATVGSRRFVTREHMLAAGEMQISGEPLAQAMGRDLRSYSRDLLPPDLYRDPQVGYWIDLPGFSAAIESYEYSKQAMNDLAFESGAGTSLVHAPLVDPTGAGGDAARARLAGQLLHYAAGSNVLGQHVFATEPLGWPGMWPTAHVFASFDPTVDPTGAFVLNCSISSDDTPGSQGTALQCADYECDATSLHLRDRAGQIDPTLTPGADGFSAWKYSLWILNYLEILHDVNEAAVADVAEADLAAVGSAGNTVVGRDDQGAPTAPGTYLGSSNIEGFQAQVMLAELDNRAADWLAHLTTSDGATLSGFGSLAAATAYDESAPLRWLPGKIAVTEAMDASGFPKPSYALASPDSDLFDLLGMAMGYATVYAVTDTSNPDVGGARTARALFDGDPFPADDQRADGEATLHDRALAMIRVVLVDLDRLHADPVTHRLAGTVTFAGATPSRGHTISTVDAAYTVIALRTVLRALSSQLELYSNNTTDTAVGTTPLDVLPLHDPADPARTFSGRLEQLVRAQADLLLDELTDASGRALPGWDLAANAPTSPDEQLDAYTAAVRGLFAAFLATGDVRYRARAIAVFDRMEAVFYDPAARMFSATPAPATSVEYTPLRFALLQSALRDMYELVATRPGGSARAPGLEEQLGRLDKLVLNGWDDRNGDQQVTSDECVQPILADGVPHGGLQMAERTLTGEIGRSTDDGTDGPTTIDRDNDCVPEIDDAHLPAALADSITFTITRP